MKILWIYFVFLTKLCKFLSTVLQCIKFENKTDILLFSFNTFLQQNQRNLNQH